MARARAGVRSDAGVEASRRGYQVQAVARAYRIFFALARSNEPKQLGELNAEVGLHKTTTLRLLRTFMAEGVVAQDPATGRYLHSPAFSIRLAASGSTASQFVSAVQDTLAETARRCLGTAMVILPDEARRNGVVTMHAFPRTSVYFDPARRPNVPMHATAAGKCFLAFAEQPQLRSYLARDLARLTGKTLTSPRHLKAELSQVRERGYATNKGEADGAVHAIAVPLRRSAGEVIGALAVGFSSRAMADRDLVRHLDVIRMAAARVSEMLGYQWWQEREAELERSSLPLPARVDSEDPGFGEGATPVVRSVARAIRLIELLVRSPQGLALPEIAKRRKLNRSAAFRLLLTLQAQSIVIRDAAEGRYRIDPLLWLRNAQLLLSAASLTKGTGAILEWLAKSTGSTAVLACPDVAQRKSIAFQYALPNRPVCFHPSNDVPPPLHAVAGGKCYLAAQSKRWIAQYISDGIGTVTDHTISSHEKLVRELAVVREQGYALNREESISGAGGLAVPVVDGSRRVAGGLALAPLVSELTDTNVAKWLPMLRAASEALSQLLVAHWREFVARVRG